MKGYVRYMRDRYKYVDKDENGYKIELYSADPSLPVISYRWVPASECIEYNEENTILTSVKSLLETQTQKGISKYGHTVKPDDYSVIGWIEHAQQEIIDQLVYLEVLKQKLKG